MYHLYGPLEFCFAVTLSPLQYTNGCNQPIDMQFALVGQSLPSAKHHAHKAYVVGNPVLLGEHSELAQDSRQESVVFRWTDRRLSPLRAPQQPSARDGRFYRRLLHFETEPSKQHVNSPPQRTLAVSDIGAASNKPSGGPAAAAVELIRLNSPRTRCKTAAALGGPFAYRMS